MLLELVPSWLRYVVQVVDGCGQGVREDLAVPTKAEVRDPFQRGLLQQCMCQLDDGDLAFASHQTIDELPTLEVHELGSQVGRQCSAYDDEDIVADSISQTSSEIDHVVDADGGEGDPDQVRLVSGEGLDSGSRLVLAARYLDDEALGASRFEYR